ILSAAVLVLLVTLAAGGTAASLVIGAQKRAETKAREDAERSAESAERHRDAALDTFDRLIFEVQERLRDQPALVGLREQLLRSAVTALQKVADITAEADTNPRRIAAHARLGDVFLELGRLDEARQQYERCQAIARQFLASDTHRSRSEFALCVATAKLGEISLRTNDVTGAE